MINEHVSIEDFDNDYTIAKKLYSKAKTLNSSISLRLNQYGIMRASIYIQVNFTICK